MVNDVLGSIDLNPIVVAVGKNTEKLVRSATDVVKDTTEGLLGAEGKPASGRPGQQSAPPPSGHRGQQNTATQAAGLVKHPKGAQQNHPQQGLSGPEQQGPPPPRTRRKNPSSVVPHGSTRAPNPVEAKDPNILWFMPQGPCAAQYDRLAPNGDVITVWCNAQGPEANDQQYSARAVEQLHVGHVD